MLTRFLLRWRRLSDPLSPSVVNTYRLDRLFQLAELLGIFDLYEATSNLLSPRLRSLRRHERKLLHSIFGHSLPYAKVRIDERARIGPRRYGIAYVSFHTLNCWGSVSPPLLVHEMVHVWQYRHRGAVYIPRALAAQRTPAGYNYGGLAGLLRAGSLDDFNYEQMATVVEDAYRLMAGYPLRYLHPADSEAAKPLFAGFLKELRSPLAGDQRPWSELSSRIRS